MSGYQTEPNPLLAEVARSIGLEHRPINQLAKVNSGANKADTIAEYAGAASLRDADARAVLDDFYSSCSVLFWDELRKLQAQETPRVEFFGEHGIFKAATQAIYVRGKAVFCRLCLRFHAAKDGFN